MLIDVETACVHDIMTRWPATLAIFIRYRMLCIGCEVAPFHTVADACAEHGLDEMTIRDELISIIAASGLDPAQ